MMKQQVSPQHQPDPLKICTVNLMWEQFLPLQENVHKIKEFFRLKNTFEIINCKPSTAKCTNKPCP